ncbi:protein kinase, partial [Streptomyces sp. SID5926]|nr:protein kinase [Streptomyces sp. SID5926]
MSALEPDDPRSVGEYRLLGRLGAGGMGRVFLGRSPGGRLVAVKVVHAELLRRPEFRDRFRREVQAARMVSGAFTAPVVDADPDAPLPWLVTSYIAGPSLEQAVA